MTADTKKVQTMVNIVAEESQKCRAARDKILAVRAAFQAINPSVAGTPLQGNLAAVNSFIDDLDALLNRAVVDGIIDAYVPSHRGKAIDF